MKFLGRGLRTTQDQVDEYRSRNQKIDDPGNGTDEPESKLTAKIAKWCKDQGYPHFHDRSKGVNVAGWLDHVIALPGGVTLYIEDKTKKGTMSDEQKQTYRMLKMLGHHVYIVRSYKQFIDIVRQF